jgi:hypothetical protein
MPSIPRRLNVVGGNHQSYYLGNKDYIWSEKECDGIVVSNLRDLDICDFSFSFLDKKKIFIMVSCES